METLCRTAECDDDGLSAQAYIDPTFSLDPAFLQQYGLTAADFSITPEDGFGNMPKYRVFATRIVHTYEELLDWAARFLESLVGVPATVG